MSYQVIARKYRPQTFTDLIGQEHITRTLGNALEQKRLHQAYIFSGARGTGKTTTARILAKGLNCRTGITSTPCLSCASCQEIAVGNSIDVLEIDAASNTGVDNVRDVIINNISIAPARDRYKVFVIDEVHMLSNNAFNALLKTLEEPPAHVIFIMATTELHKVPDTILSRCQQFEFRYIPVDKTAQRLREIAVAEKITISDAALRQIARAGAGSLRDAQSAFDQVIAFCGTDIKAEDVTASLGLVGEKTLLDFIAAIAAQDSPGILNLVDELDSRGYDLRNFTRELMAYLRHMLVIKAGITSTRVLTVAEAESVALEELAAQFSAADLVRFFHLLAATEKEIKDSPHPRFQLEIGLIRMAQAVRLRSLDELIARLEALEGKLSVGEATGDSRDSNPHNSAALSSSVRSVRTTKPADDRKKESDAGRGRIIKPATLAKPDYSPVRLEEPPDFAASFNNEASSEPLSYPARTPPPEAAGQSGAIVPGQEIKAILAELERMNRHALVTALEDAQELSYQNGRLLVTVAADDPFTRRLRDSGDIFRAAGERLFGQPLNIEISLSQRSRVAVDEPAQADTQLREQAMKNPAVRKVLDKFRGEITDVRRISS